MPQFQYIYFLLLLALVPLVWLVYLYARAKKKKVISKIGDEAVVNQLLSNYKKSSFLKKFLLSVIGMILLIIALANLRIAGGASNVNRNGIDVMIAFDVSKSMLAQDVKPTRLDRAKQVLNRLIDRLGNDRIGIVVFAGKAYLQMPLSADHAAAKMYLSAASPESIPTQGTVISDALKMCYASFNSKEKKYKAVVLISDGEDHDEKALATAAEMSDAGVVIHSIGIGSVAGSPILDEATGDLKKDEQGNTVITKLNETELQSIAEKGSGTYQLFSNTDNVVSNIVAQLNTMDQRAVKDDSMINYQSFFQYFLFAAFLFLIIELFVAETKKTKKMKLKPVITTALLLMISAYSFAQEREEKEQIKIGNEAFKTANFPGAADNYNAVVKKNPENATAQYNLGNAFYKSDKKEESVKAYDNAIRQLKKPVEKGNAYYNKGVVYQNDKKLPECIDAYKNALKLNPDNEDARQNLQKALQQQKQQQQQQQQQDKKQDQKKDKQDQKQEPKQEPKPQPSKITQKDAEEKLKALMQKEKNLQDKLHKVNAASVNKPEKDW